MRRLLDAVSQIAAHPAGTLICGERGTGKERMSGRRTKMERELGISETTLRRRLKELGMVRRYRQHGRKSGAPRTDRGSSPRTPSDDTMGR